MTSKFGKHSMWHTEPLDSCFNLIRSHHQRISYLPHWRLNQRSQDAEPKLYHWATGPHSNGVPNQLMVNARPNNQIEILKTIQLCTRLQVGCLALMPGGASRTSIDLHCFDHPGQVNLNQQGHLAYVPGDLAKASTVHIVPSDPVQQCTSLSPRATFSFLNPHYKKTLCQILPGGRQW